MSNLDVNNIYTREISFSQLSDVATVKELCKIRAKRDIQYLIGTF